MLGKREYMKTHNRRKIVAITGTVLFAGCTASVMDGGSNSSTDSERPRILIHNSTDRDEVFDLTVESSRSGDNVYSDEVAISSDSAKTINIPDNGDNYSTNIESRTGTKGSYEWNPDSSRALHIEYSDSEFEFVISST
jgi:hypothetical protein